LKMTTRLARYSIVILLVAAVNVHVYSKSGSPAHIDANAWQVPPEPHPIEYFDIYTQKSGKGPSEFGGTFGLEEDIILYVEIAKGSIPLVGQPITFEILGPANSYRNISTLLRTVTNSSGIGSTSLKILLTPEHPESVTGSWMIQAQMGLDEETVGDEMDLEVASITSEFPFLTVLLLAFIFATAIAVILKRRTRL